MSYFGVSLRNGVGLGLGTVPSLTNTPLSYRLAPSLNLSFAGSDSLSPAITFNRTTNATLTNSAGLVAYAPTNLLTYSEQFDNAAWTKGNVTVAANVLAAPNGTVTSDKLVEDTTTAIHRLQSGGMTLNFSAGVTYTLTVYAQAGGRQYLNLNANSAFNARSTFDLVAGTVASTLSGTASITSVGGGWYRCVVVGTATATGTNSFYYQLSTTSSSGDVSYTGDGVSGAYLWGAQLGTSSTASTYNPTTVKNLLGYTENFDNAAWTKSNSFVQTNLLTYSQDFDNAAWQKTILGAGTAPVVVANNAVAPDGSTTADTITFVAPVSGDASFINEQTAATIGVTYTNSVYVKAATVSDVGKILLYRGVAGSGYSQVTLTTEYQRVQVTGVAAGSTVSFDIGLRPQLGGSSGTVSVALWGAQLVQGASAGDYKATYAAAAAVGYTDIYGQPFAQKLVEDTANTWHGVRQPASTGLVGIFSFYAKAAERSRVWVAFDTPDFIGAVATFNLSAGTVQSGTGTITDAGNGWYRCSVSGTVSARGVTLAVANDAGTVIRAGDGTSGIYIFGAQLSDSASVDPYVYQPVAAPSSVAYYGPRFDYDPVTLQPKGLLIEEQRTNLVLNSSILNTQIVTVTAAAHTLSFYGTGTIVLSGAYTGTLVGTGDYPTRTTLTFTPIVGALTLTVTGSVTMAQLEAGAFATSYIPTVASQVTRAADSASMIGNNFARWYNVNAGSLFIQFQLISGNVAGNNANIVAFEGAAGANMTLHRDSAAGWRYRTNLANLNVTGVSDVASNKTVFAYATSDYPFDAAGGAVQLNTGVGAPPVTTSLLIGAGSNYAAAKPINGTISRIAYYPKRLSNTELQGITA